MSNTAGQKTAEENKRPFPALLTSGERGARRVRRGRGLPPNLQELSPSDTPTWLRTTTHLLFWVLLLSVLLTTSWRDGLWSWGPVVEWPTSRGHRAPIGLLSLFPILFLASWALWRWRGATRPWQWGPFALTLPLLLLSGRLLIGLPLAPTWFTLTQLLGLFFLWTVYLFFINERPEWRWPLLALVVIQGSVALAQFILQAPVGLDMLGELSLDPVVNGTSVVAARGERWLRGYGLTSHPNFLGALLATLLLILLPAFLRLRGGRRLLFAAGWLLGLLGLFVTFSRAALLGFAIGSVVVLAQTWRAGILDRRALATVVGTVLIGVVLLTPYYDLILSRVLSLESPTEAASLQERARDARLAIKVIGENPWGVGSGRYKDVAQEQISSAQVVHNLPLLAMAEFGVVGAVAWLLLFLAALGVWPPGPPFAPWVALIVISLFDVTLWPFGSARPALLFALLLGVLAQQVKGRPALGGSALSRGRMIACFGLLALTLLFPFEAVQPLLRVGDLIAFSTVEIVLFSAFALWLGSCLWERRVPAVPGSLRVPILVWLAVVLLAALLAPAHQLTALKFWSRMLNGVLIAWMAYDLTRSPPCWSRIVRGLAGVAIIVGLFGLAEAAGWSALVAPFKTQIARVGDIDRISATLDYPTVAAMVLELTIPLLVVWLSQGRGWWRLGLVAGLVAALLTLVLTLSRAGVVGAASGLLLLLAAAWWRRATPAARPLALWSGGSLVLLALLTLIVFTANPLTRLRLQSETEQDWYQAAYRADPIPELRPGERRRVPVQVRNLSVRAWDSTTTEPFALAYHLYDSDESLIEYEGPRTFIEEGVQPGEVVEVQALLVAPERPGTYLIEWDMVQEGVAWFSWKEAEPLRQSFTVSGTPTTEEPLSPDAGAGAPPELLRIPTPTRLVLWQAALVMVRDRPILGVGPDTFRLNYGHYSGTELWDTNIHANNLYLEWLAGTGVLGLLAFLWLSWRLLRMAGEALTRARDDRWPWVAGVSVALLAWYLHGLLDYFFIFTPTYVAFWLFVGLLASARDRDTMFG